MNISRNHELEILASVEANIRDRTKTRGYTTEELAIELEIPHETLLILCRHYAQMNRIVFRSSMHADWPEGKSFPAVGGGVRIEAGVNLHGRLRELRKRAAQQQTTTEAEARS